jgi:hypothetical protein
MTYPPWEDVMSHTMGNLTGLVGLVSLLKNAIHLCRRYSMVLQNGNKTPVNFTRLGTVSRINSRGIWVGRSEVCGDERRTD